MGRLYENILETVGNTPVVKIEAFNPLGLVKDRLALGVCKDAA